MRSRSIISAAVVVLTATTPLPAQSIATSGGVEYRISGDTIWRRRDTTMTRSVFKGDTLERTYSLNGQRRTLTTYVQNGDSARVIDHRTFDTQGTATRSPTDGSFRAVPMPIVDIDGQAILLAMRMERTREMTSAYVTRPTMPESPSASHEYAFRANTRIVQIGDTIRYIMGCEAAPPVDTTTYLMFGADSVRRLSRAPRTFDRYLNTAIRADIESAIIRRSAASRDVPPSTPVPALRRWPCDRR
ncbi:MAG: hypothetical protein IBJ03_18795 [Gemmatimonadaceae bacterium]|nr:hypothetical protein [Gemmatimonadaceae bacterium]